MIKQYLERADDIIGKRTPAEVAYDNTVIALLEQGLPIHSALDIAARQHPKEALIWDTDSINDIAAHYDYLKEHMKIIRKLEMIKRQ